MKNKPLEDIGNLAGWALVIIMLVASAWLASVG